MALPIPVNALKQLLIVAENRIDNKQELLGGLLCCAFFEAYIIQQKNIRARKEDNTVDFIRYLKNHRLIDHREHNVLQRLRQLRNNIIHFGEAKEIHPNAAIDSAIEDSKKIKEELINFFYRRWEYADYEELADAEASLFPNWWSAISTMEDETTSGPNRILPEYFANLKTAQMDYMLPLGAYLQRNCLAELDQDLKFTDLSRVNSTSGYVWMSAVRSKYRRARVKYPGLTVLFMPHEIAVYLELPGKSHKYKKEYYSRLLYDDDFLNYISSPKVLGRNFEFFHTWWYATREPICSINQYVNDVNNKEGLWFDVKQKSEEMSKILAENQPIFTQNFYLLGKGYQRKQILDSEHLSTRIHEEIAADLQTLYPIYEMLQKMVSD